MIDVKAIIDGRQIGQASDFIADSGKSTCGPKGVMEWWNNGPTRI